MALKTPFFEASLGRVFRTPFIPYYSGYFWRASYGGLYPIKFAHMIEFNGWVCLALSTDGEGEDAVTRAVQALLPLVDKIRGHATFPFVQARNGSYYLHVAGSANHNGVDWAETNDLLHETARRFPGAYGLVHLRDDEDTQGNDNAFVVYVVRRSTVECHADPFLSPCNPVIED
jgi:hypothetical protein